MKGKAMPAQLHLSFYTKHVVRISNSKQSFSHGPLIFSYQMTFANSVHLCTTLQGQYKNEKKKKHEVSMFTWSPHKPFERMFLYSTGNIQKQLKSDPERKILHQKTLKIN